MELSRSLRAGSFGEAQGDLLGSSSMGRLRAPKLRAGVQQPGLFLLLCCREVVGGRRIGGHWKFLPLSWGAVVALLRG